MARAIYHGSASPASASPSFSDSDSESNSTFADPHVHTGYSISRANSPGSSQASETGDGHPIVEDSVTCEWDGCGKIYTHLPTLIEHIHHDHIGVHKSSYSCEWASCTRRGLAQTSRFALISHIRSHTGEKPFICTLPECDKSFTRSDALAKHMRLQHHISPPAPGRGGSRKRKRNGADDPGPSSSSRPPETPNDANLRWSSAQRGNQEASGGSGFGQFKVEPHTPSETDGVAMFEGGEGGSYFSGVNGSAKNGHGSHHPTSPSYSGLPLPSVHRPPSPTNVLDLLPSYLLSKYDEPSGTILGRTPYQVMYLLTKAKYKYAKEQQDELMAELRVTENDLQRLMEDKERLLDDVMRAVGGPDADQFILPIPAPQEAHEVGREGSPHHQLTDPALRRAHMSVNGNSA